MSAKGDVHNFGRYVRKVEKNGLIFFYKPRPIVNELFLFGKISPLKSIIYKAVQNEKTLESWDKIFSLEGSFVQNEWCSHCGQIAAIERITKDQIKEISNNRSKLKKLVRQYGVTMAYCHAFGVADINIENCILNEQGIYVIDAESSFNILRYVSETNCIGFDNFTKFVSGFSLFRFFTQGYVERIDFSESDYCLDPELLRDLLEGYLEGIDVLCSVQTQLKEESIKFLSEMADVPLRVVLRNSQEYTLKTPPNIPFIEEELTQMNRGDIPYFFSTYQDRRIFYITDPQGTRKTVDFPEFHPFWFAMILKPRYDSELLFSPERFQFMRAVGAIEIFRELNKESTLKSMEINGTIISRDEKLVHYTYKDIKYQGENRGKDYNGESLGLSYSIVQVKD